MAIAMQEKIAAVVRRIGLSSSPPEQILFTGHSAGGAIAQLLYMLSMQKNRVLGRAVEGKQNISDYRIR